MKLQWPETVLVHSVAALVLFSASASGDTNAEFVSQPPALTPELAGETFDQLWDAFDKKYAMFVLRPEVDWAKLREHYRPKALASKSADEMAGVCAEMLKNLRDLHVWLTVADSSVPVFNRPRSANANPKACRAILGRMTKEGRVAWAVTTNHIGFIAIYGWDNPNIPAQCAKALEQMRDTRGLIVDVRMNGGGSEPLAEKFAARFLQKEFVYAYSRFRNGPFHTNLTEKEERTVAPGGPWRYDRPVVVLIGQKCMSSDESFVGMMTGDPQVKTMGDHTCGSSGNPEIIHLPLDMTVSVPQWIDYLPDGTPLDERGFQPQIPFQPDADAFEGDRDDLLTAALARLSQEPLPAKPIEGPAFEAPKTMGPEIVLLDPPNGATDVSPALKELRVTFNVRMSGGMSWCGGGPNFPTVPEGKQAYWTQDGKTCVLPVELKPGWEYELGLNCESFKNFRSQEREPLEPVDYTFKTSEKP
jgi:hypothetical protein